MDVARSARRSAELTPAGRNRHVDLLRAFAISVVVIGHWLAMVVITGDGVAGANALSALGWAHPITWILQVMPVFFLVGGYAHGAALRSHHRHGGDSLGWLLDRTGRLLRPTTTFLLALTAVGAGAPLLGADAELTATGVWAASIPLWFLAVYLSLVFLAPPLYALHRRFGLVVPVVVAVIVLAIDIARMRFGVPFVGDANYLLVWLVFHQLGIAWRDGTITPRPAVAGALAGAGVATLVGLTALGPYPVSMVGVPGEELQNTAPPTFALLVLGLTQAAVALMLDRPVNGFLRRTRPWTAVITVNAVILTAFLWHMSAAVVAAMLLYPTGVLPQPPVDTGEWLLWRLPWLAGCGVVLAAFVAVFARIEIRSARTESGGRMADAAVLGIRLPVSVWRLLVVVGIAGVVGGMVTIAVLDPDPDHLALLPTTGLAAYLIGAGLLRLARGHTVCRPGSVRPG